MEQETLFHMPERVGGEEAQQDSGPVRIQVAVRNQVELRMAPLVEQHKQR